jgi:hypothetical protein
VGSVLYVASQFDTERTYLHPQAVFHKIKRGEPVPLGEEGDRKWAVPHAITMVQQDEADDDYRSMVP